MLFTVPEGQYGSRPGRLAVDYIMGDIYYTAVPVYGGFVGIGKITPQGLHTKLIQYGSSPGAIALDIDHK